MNRLLFSFFTFLFSILLHSCTGNSEEKPTLKIDTLPSSRKTSADASIPGNFSSQTSFHFDSTELEKFLKKYDSLRIYRKDLTDFYKRKNFAYAWFDSAGLIEQSSILSDRVMHIEEEGLPQQTPYLNTYRKMMSGEDSLNTILYADPEKEIMITAQYLAFVRKVWGGIPEDQSRKMEWYVPRKKLDYNQLLDSMLGSAQTGQIIQEPVYRQYKLLKNYLKSFREIEKQGLWLTIKADKKKYQEGDSSLTVQMIRKKLFLTGDLKENNNSAVYDQTITAAVKQFQRRYGLKQDGIIGQAILKEMDAPLSRRIQQIIVNMERCRWVDNDPRGNYMVVNIPQFQLLAYENDHLVWTMNVVVGKEVHKTAIFHGHIKYIVFSPYWNVPSSILKNEILPAIRRNPNYLAMHDMEWNGNQVRQKPGPDNSLGKVKFLFPNSFNMYLHDSPAKSLFEEEKRTFSHGCIRVAEARKLAIYLLRNDKSWTESKIDESMNNRTEQYVTLKEPIPVNIVYFTAWVDEEGKINFRDDIYKRDSRLMEAIFAKK